MISKFLIILVLLAAGFHYFGQGVNLRTDEAIAKELVPAGMNTLQTEELRDIIKTERKPILLLIYASWCPYCKKQMEEKRRRTIAGTVFNLKICPKQHPGRF